MSKWLRNVTPSGDALSDEVLKEAIEVSAAIIDNDDRGPVMSTQHTPGPWEFMHAWVQTEGDKKTPIANLNFYAATDANGWRIVLCCNMHDELLAALREARSLVVEAFGSSEKNAVNRIDAAIAKATGDASHEQRAPRPYIPRG